MLADTFSKLISTTVDRYEPITTRSLIQENELFATRLEQTVYDLYLLDLALVHQEQKKYQRNRNIEISA